MRHITPSRIILLTLISISILPATNVALHPTKALPLHANPSDQYIHEYSLGTPDASPGPVTVSPNGTVWFVETNGSRIAKVNSTGGVTEFPFKGNGTYTPTWLTILTTQALVSDSAGTLWFSFPNSNMIGYFRTTSQAFGYYDLTHLTGLADSLPYEIAVNPDGTIWFSEAGVSGIGKLNPSTGTARDYNLTEPGGRHFLPYGVAFDRNGSLWVTSLWYQNGNGGSQITGSALIRLNATTGQTTLFDLTGSGITTPVGIAIDRNGRIWLGDHAGSWLGEFDIGTGRVTLHWVSLPPLTPNHRTLIDRNGYDITLISYNIVLGADGTPWFMEHLGGRVGHYIPANDNLVEYNIPTRNPQTPFIASDNQGRIWFTELATDKFGYLDTRHAQPSFKVAHGAMAPILVAGDPVSVSVNVTNMSPNSVNITVGIDSTEFFGSPLTNTTLVPGATRTIGVMMNTSASFTQPGNYSLGRLAYAVPVLTITDGNVNIAIPVIPTVLAPPKGPDLFIYVITGALIGISMATGTTMLYWRREKRK